MQIQIIYILFTVLTSCDSNGYYKTFDYRTMTFVETTEKTENCVRLISQTENKIELEVLYYNNRIRRTFIKRENYWYSKFKYEEPSIPEYKAAYGGVHEIQYFIFYDHIVYKDDAYLVYVDLMDKKKYFFDELQIENFQNVKLESLIKKDYRVIDYYVSFDTLYQRDRDYFGSGILKEEVINNLSTTPLLDIFFWMDEDIYNLGSTKKPIYD